MRVLVLLLAGVDVSGRVLVPVLLLPASGVLVLVNVLVAVGVAVLGAIRVRVLVRVLVSVLVSTLHGGLRQGSWRHAGGTACPLRGGNRTEP